MTATTACAKMLNVSSWSIYRNESPYVFYPGSGLLIFVRCTEKIIAPIMLVLLSCYKINFCPVQKEELSRYYA